MTTGTFTSKYCNWYLNKQNKSCGLAILLRKHAELQMKSFVGGYNKVATTITGKYFKKWYIITAHIPNTTPKASKSFLVPTSKTHKSQPHQFTMIIAGNLTTACETQKTLNSSKKTY